MGEVRQRLVVAIPLCKSASKIVPKRGAFPIPLDWKITVDLDFQRKPLKMSETYETFDLYFFCEALCKYQLLKEDGIYGLPPTFCTKVGKEIRLTLAHLD